MHHQRDQIAVFNDRARDQLSGGIGGMMDIGIGQQQILGGQAERVDRANALRLRPHLARPAGRQRLGGQHRETVFEPEVARGGHRDGGGLSLL